MLEWSAKTSRCSDVGRMLGQRLRRLANIKTTSIRRIPNACLMLGEHHRQWCNIKPTLCQRLCWNGRRKQVVAEILVECWDGVLDGWPTLKQHRFTYTQCLFNAGRAS